MKMFKALLFAFGLLISPALADSTIDHLAPGAALTGSESIPMVQGSNPAKRTSPAAIKTYVGAPGGPPTGVAGGDLTGTYPNPLFVTVNANVGTFGSATQCVITTVNAKGLTTAISATPCTVAIGSISGLNALAATALGLAPNTAGGVLVPASALTARGVLYGGGSGVTPGSTAAGINGQLFLGVTAAAPQWGSMSGDATIANTGVLTLATVNANTGPFGSATQCAVVTNNSKGLTTAVSAVTCTPAIGSVTGWGTGVLAALQLNVGSAGAPVLFNGAGGTPSAMVGTNITGTAAGLTAGTVTTNANLTGAVISTGNATSLGSFNSAALAGALTNETGSGLAVFGTSPNITTPTGIVKGDVGLGNVANVDTTNAANISSSILPAARSNGHQNGTATNDNAAAGEIGEVITAAGATTPTTFTVTIAAPAVVTFPTNVWTQGCTGNGTAPFVPTTSGALPTGLVSGTTYWIICTTVSGNTAQIATSLDNAVTATAITTTGSQSGTHTATSPSNIASTVDLAGVRLSAGDWEVNETVYANPTGTTSITDVTAYISTGAANSFDVTPGRYNQLQSAAFVPSTGSIVSVAVPGYRLSLSTVTTARCTSVAVFTVSTLTGTCFIKARRAR